jgi:hypothetical protein
MDRLSRLAVRQVKVETGEPINSEAPLVPIGRTERCIDDDIVKAVTRPVCYRAPPRVPGRASYPSRPETSRQSAIVTSEASRVLRVSLGFIPR